MPLTREFRETVGDRARKSAAFRHALLSEAAAQLLNGDLDTAKSTLRDAIKATIGYRDLNAVTEIPEKSLIRMFGPTGNPRAAHLSCVLEALLRHEGVRLEVRAARRSDAA